LAGKNIGSLPCLTKGSNSDGSPSSFIKVENYEKSLDRVPFLDQTFNNSAVIHNYYNHFHNSHPILPPLAEIDVFLSLIDYPKEIVGLMKVLGDGYLSSKYSKNINEIFQIASEIIELIGSKDKDVITLQALILLSLVCHVSALHDLSTSLRKQAIELAVHLDINNLDEEAFTGEDINGNVIQKKNRASNGSTPGGSSSDEINMNFYNTRRVRTLPDVMLKESARRCFWELFFLDIIIGSADGKTLSKLTSIKCFVQFPSIPTKFQFDYETRSYTSKLVDDSVRLNNIIFSEMSIGHQYTKLTASLSNWELKFSNPDFYKLPYLIDGNGRVNEGIQQGLIMLNYAKIFTHRPLSFLWRSDIPRNLKCVEKLNDELNKTENNFQEVPNGKDLINSRKIIETRKTIDAANLIAKTLIDTNPIDILKRTPLNACSLAFAGLVHLSAYLWSSQVAQTNENQNHLNSNDLNIYEEYMKLELSGIFQISAHWYLSSKIANYLLDSISKLLPNLFTKMQIHFQHHIESNKRLDNDSTKKQKLKQQRKELDEKQRQLSKDSDLSKVFNAPTGYIETGMSYDLPILSPQAQTSAQYQALEAQQKPQTQQKIYSQSPASNSPSAASTVSTLNQRPALNALPLQPNNLLPLVPAFVSPAMPLSKSTGTVGSNNAIGNDFDERIFKIPADFDPVSPNSDTGCDWIDNNQLDFDFKNYNFGEFDIDSLSAIDDMIKSATNMANPI
jgi:hypothetical protein